MSNSPMTNAIIIISLLFCATITVGWVGTMKNPAIGENLMKLFEKEVAGQIMGKDSPEIFIRLFFNNIEACLLLFLGGASFGILTIFIMSLNGVLIGSIMEIVHHEHSSRLSQRRSCHTVFLRFLHSFFPARSVSCSPSHSLPSGITGRTQQKMQNGSRGCLPSMYMPLVAIAAFVEAFITPVIIHLVA